MATESNNEHDAPSNQFLKEKLFLAQQAAEAGIPALPGKSWALHYPDGGAARQAQLAGLLAGTLRPEEATSALRPDGLIYDTSELATQGLGPVIGRIRETSAYIQLYDYAQFARFATSLQGSEATPELAQALYNGIAKPRIQKKLFDAYGHTGKNQITQALQLETQTVLNQMANLTRVERVLSALKIGWLHENMNIASAQERDAAMAQLSGDERALLEQLKVSYQQYAQRGTSEDFEALVHQVKDSIPIIKKQPEEQPEEDSDSMQQLRDELEQYQNQTGPPGTNKDSGIPPDDQDEYMPQKGQAKEKTAASPPYFEIKPSGTSKAPLTGYYCSGHTSYYDRQTKTWSKKKQLSGYTGAVAGEARQTISGTIDAGLKALPIPNTYALDISSIKYSGSKPEFFRDQNGCFYLQSSAGCTFEVDFLTEPSPFIGPPTAQDLEPLYDGSLSTATEDTIRQLRGNALQKAQQARQYLLAHHFYPGGGDLSAASALQYKLQNESTADNYFQHLDSSEYLECYSANTLFIAMLRKAGVTARLVRGHKVEGARDGKAAINSNTGHAWAEVWDGSCWRRVDATPAPKPEDKKPADQPPPPDGSPTQEAEDGGLPSPPQPGQGKTGQGTPTSSQGDPSSMPEASDQEMQQAQDDLQQTQTTMNEMQAAQKQLAEQISQAKNFKQLKQLQQEASKTDLTEEMKAELEQKLEAKEEQMKKEIQDKLDQMTDDGFMEEKERQRLEEELDKKDLEELDKMQAQIKQENQLYNDYEEIRREVEPLVDKWFAYFAERLPKESDIEADEDSLTRAGRLNKRALIRPRNMILGTVKNPRVIKSSVRPRFIGSIMLDVSGSMKEQGKLINARKSLVFYSELFSRISREYGYIRFSVNIFADGITPIKGFDQDYESIEHYAYSDGSHETVKARLMKKTQAKGGTNMLDAIKEAAHDLNREVADYPDFVSAFYFIGDGEDTCGNSAKVREFLQLNDRERGFGDHLRSAILMGSEANRSTLASIFGEEHTTVAPGFDELIEQSMYKFDDHIEEYLRFKTI